MKELQSGCDGYLKETATIKWFHEQVADVILFTRRFLHICHLCLPILPVTIG